MHLTKSQLKALKSYMAERDVAIAGIKETLTEAGLDPEAQYNVDFTTGEVLPFQPAPVVPEPSDEAVALEAAFPEELPLDKSE